jgi:hypothetical protein
MKIGSRLLSAFLATGLIAIAAGGAATAQGMEDRMAPGIMQGDKPSGMGPGMMQGRMGQGMMGPGAGKMRGVMGQGMMCPMMAAMMQGGQGMMGPAMMGSETMRGGMAALFGSRVTPPMNLSVEDARSYLAQQLERLNNKRLKLGNVTAAGEAISAEIVTVDNSLVQRLKIDRHTGTIEYES